MKFFRVKFFGTELSHIFEMEFLKKIWNRKVLGYFLGQKLVHGYNVTVPNFLKNFIPKHLGQKDSIKILGCFFLTIKNDTKKFVEIENSMKFLSSRK